MRRYRNRQKGVTTEGVTEEGVTLEKTKDGTYFKDGIEMVPASYVQGLQGAMYQFLPERPRYVTLSDGQVMDRAFKPEIIPLSGVRIQAIRASNETLDYKPNTGVLPESLRKRLNTGG